MNKKNKNRFLSHRGASCPNDRALPCDCSSYASPYPNPTTLFGALVGGPNVVAARQSGSSSAPSSGFFGFFDSRESYQTNEPALDYNAGWLVTTMSLAAMDEAAPQPGTLAATTMSSATTPLPVSQNAANSDSDAWDSCFDLGLGTYPQLPRAFLADLRKATTSSIASSRYEGGSFFFFFFRLLACFSFQKENNLNLGGTRKKTFIFIQVLPSRHGELAQVPGLATRRHHAHGRRDRVRRCGPRRQLAGRLWWAQEPLRRRRWHQAKRAHRGGSSCCGGGGREERKQPGHRCRCACRLRQASHCEAAVV
jgi:hypothetical protein